MHRGWRPVGLLPAVKSIDGFVNVNLLSPSCLLSSETFKVYFNLIFRWLELARMNLDKCGPARHRSWSLAWFSNRSTRTDFIPSSAAWNASGSSRGTSLGITGRVNTRSVEVEGFLPTFVADHKSPWLERKISTGQNPWSDSLSVHQGLSAGYHQTPPDDSKRGGATNELSTSSSASLRTVAFGDWKQLYHRHWNSHQLIGEPPVKVVWFKGVRRTFRRSCWLWLQESKDVLWQHERRCGRRLCIQDAANLRKQKVQPSNTHTYGADIPI